MPTATITGPVYGVSQTFDFISMSIVFELSHWDSIDDVGLIASGPIIVPVDENGQFSVDLVLNSAGSQVTNYQCFLQYRRTDGTEWIREPIGVFSLTAEGTYQLSDLTIISVEGVESSLDVYTQILSILDTVNTSISTTAANVVSSNTILEDAETVLTNVNTVYQNVQNYGNSLLKFKNLWVTATDYEASEIVAYEDFLYICLVDHTSDTFETDFSANDWQVFAAINPLSNGSEPSVITENMLWYDTANDILKMRSEANDIWITIGTFDQVNNTFTVALTEVLNSLTVGTASTTKALSEDATISYVEEYVGEVVMGVGQIPVDVTADYTHSTWYQNTGTKPQMIVMRAVSTNASTGREILVSSDTVTSVNIGYLPNNNSGTAGVQIVVPPGWYWQIDGGATFIWITRYEDE